MQIADEHVAILRTQLMGNFAEHRRLLEQLDDQEANTLYAALVSATFIKAVQGFFIDEGKTTDESEVIDFVARVRERSDDSSDLINPQLAESMILDLLGKGTMVETDPDTMIGHQMVLLAAVVGEKQFTDAEIDALLSSSRSLADELIE
ncbi:hypothetical protein LUW76_08170 [Actinomadura madurae]|uniref:hypothetical protein n=1 Tax=Actinomadura madurae TaxID=1993 RepID=UPI0020276781|nr:hypothetical protein [Actinomadura madurae]URM94307.1 hypothetical protein LUW76_08170 [Actinomadura madurae]